MKRAICILLCFLFCQLTAISLAESSETNGNEDIFTADYIISHHLIEGTTIGLQSIAWSGDVCYAYLSDMSIYTYQTGQDPKKVCMLPEAPASLNYAYVNMDDNDLQQLYNTVTYTVADKSGLYGYNVYTGKFGKIDESGIHWNDILLDVSCLNPYGNFFPNRIAQSILAGQTLFSFVSTTTGAGDSSYELWGFDLTTGMSTAYEISNAVGICKMNDTSLLLLCIVEEGYALRKLDILTNSVQDIPVSMAPFSATSLIGGLAYQDENDIIALTCRGTVYESVQGEPFQAVAYVPAESIMPETSAILLPDGRYALSLGGVHIRVPSEQPERTALVCQMPTISIALKNNFSSQYPQIEWNVIYETLTADDIATMMSTQSDQVDLFEVRADSLFMKLVKKGYVAPLSSSSLIALDVQQMDDRIRSILYNEDGDVIAYPSRLYFEEYQYNKGFWELAFPDRPFPTTMVGVLEAWLEWEQDFADEYPEVEFVNAYDYVLYVKNILSFYIKQTDRQGTEPDLKNAQLRYALELLAQINQLRERGGRHTTLLSMDEAEGLGYIFKFSSQEAMRARGTLLLRAPENYLYDVYMYDYTVVSLAFSDEQTPGTDGILYVYMVNPYSKHKEEALRLIECAVSQEVNPYLFYAVHPQCGTPYPDADIDRIIEQFQQEKAAIEEVIQTTDGDVKEQLTAQLDFCEQYIAQQEQLKWLISEETIAQDRLRMEQLQLHEQSLFVVASGTSLDEIVTSLCEQYCAGRFGADHFLSQLQSRMSIIRMESN